MDLSQDPELSEEQKKELWKAVYNYNPTDDLPFADLEKLAWSAYRIMKEDFCCTTKYAIINELGGVQKTKLALAFTYDKAKVEDHISKETYLETDLDGTVYYDFNLDTTLRLQVKRLLEEYVPLKKMLVKMVSEFLKTHTTKVKRISPTGELQCEIHFLTKKEKAQGYATKFKVQKYDPRKPDEISIMQV